MESGFKCGSGEPGSSFCVMMDILYHVPHLCGEFFAIFNELNSNKIANVANVGYQSVSIDDITDTFAILQTTSITDIPDNIKSDLGDWVLVSTFKKTSGTGVQFITSLFTITSANAKIYKRHLASATWSNFQSIN